MKKKIIRESDGLTKTGEIKFVSWKKNNTFKNIHKKPKIRYSIIVNPQYGISYTWLTTPITEIPSKNRFKTENSVYRIEDE